MKIHFYQPSAEQRLGGLDAAIIALRSALQVQGHEVSLDPARGESLADVVHFHGLWQRSFRSIAAECRRRRIPYVVSPHGMLEEWAWRHKWWKKFPYWHVVEKRWIKKSARLFATSSSEASRLAQFVPDVPCTVLPLGLTSDAGPNYDASRRHLGWPPDENVLVFLSRIHPKKGLDLLLAALTKAANVPAKCRLVIVGPEEDAAYSARCRNFATENKGRLPLIEWAGAVWGEKRWTYLQGADLFCLPTHSENFGLAVLEACQVGTPVLTTTATPWATILPAQGGYIAKPEVESLTIEMERYFRSAAQPEKRAKLAKWTHDQYDWSVLCPQYSSIYGEVAHSRRRSQTTQ
jgi:glycosyltransferase involved in cell wall biosynthesis